MILEFVRFLQRSPTVFHAAVEISNGLAEADFSPLEENERWELEAGQKYFLIRGGSLIAAFRLPKEKPNLAKIIVSHLDSPCLKIKPEAEMTNRSIGQFGTEAYGSPILHTWLDRNLYLAGKITVANDVGPPISHLVKLDEYPVIIPGLALHLDRNVTEKGFFVNKQDHLKPVYSLRGEEIHLEQWLKKHHGFQKLLNYDLFLIPSEPPSFMGFESELLASYRLDNLTSAFAALHAMIYAESTSELQVAFFFDHEEVGSRTYVGADSRFADEILERISLFYKMDREDFFRLKANSLCISADLAHGFNPSFADKYDPQNAPLLGKGPVLKFHANQAYATQSESASFIQSVAEKNQISLQKYASRSDIPSGSTIGSIIASQLGIPTVDLGIAGWSMHSVRETIACKDEEALCLLLKAAID